jgi:hypothetical protein
MVYGACYKVVHFHLFDLRQLAFMKFTTLFRSIIVLHFFGSSLASTIDETEYMQYLTQAQVPWTGDNAIFTVTFGSKLSTLTTRMTEQAHLKRSQRR